MIICDKCFSTYGVQQYQISLVNTSKDPDDYHLALCTVCWKNLENALKHEIAAYKFKPENLKVHIDKPTEKQQYSVTWKEELT